MDRATLLQECKLSPIIHGWWRLPEWRINKQEILQLIEQCIEIGVTSFDHADIYGDYTCEEQFGGALKQRSDLRSRIQIITKCGIEIVSKKYPQRKVKCYNYSKAHIIKSVNQSLKHFHTDYIDLFLLHRPSPLMNPEEIAEVFQTLFRSGKVRFFGVSNFTPSQFAMLDAFCEQPLITNQLEISPYQLNHFFNGNLEFCTKEKICPMAWSPIGGGKLFQKPQTPQDKTICDTVTQIAKELGAKHREQVLYQWIMRHPARIVPVIGTSKIERIRQAMQSREVRLSHEQWFQIYTAATGSKLP